MEQIYFDILKFMYEHPNGLNEMMFEEKMFFRRTVAPIFGYSTHEYKIAFRKLHELKYTQEKGNAPTSELQGYILSDAGQKVYLKEKRIIAIEQQQRLLVYITAGLTLILALTSAISAYRDWLEVCILRNAY